MENNTGVKSTTPESVESGGWKTATPFPARRDVIQALGLLGAFGLGTRVVSAETDESDDEFGGNSSADGAESLADDSTAGSITAERARVPDKYVVYKFDGDVYADGPTPEESIEGEDLPSVLDETYELTDEVTVLSDTYTYSTDLYLPSGCSIHFESGTVLNPDGCHGIRTGDDVNEHLSQRISGRATIAPAQTGSTPLSGLYVNGSKLLQVGATLQIQSGFESASLWIDGGGEGCWWNTYSGIDVRGRTLIENSQSGNVTAQNFENCLFKGQFDWMANNSLLATECFWEGIAGDRAVRIHDGTRLHIGGRFEGVEIVVEEDVGTIEIEAHSVSAPFEIDDKRTRHDRDLFVSGVGMPEYQRQRFYRHQAVNTENFFDIVDGGTKQSRDTATMNVESVYTNVGESQTYRSVATRGGGYHLLGQRYPNSDPTTDPVDDKEIEVLGDFVNHRQGKGFVATNENGDQYRISVDSDGEIQSEEV